MKDISAKVKYSRDEKLAETRHPAPEQIPEPRLALFPETNVQLL